MLLKWIIHTDTTNAIAEPASKANNLDVQVMWHWPGIRLSFIWFHSHCSPHLLVTYDIFNK